MSKTLAGTSLGLGIASLLLGWIPLLGWLLIIIALIVGIIAVIKTTKETGKTMAIIGLALSILSFVFFIIFVGVIGSLAYFGVMNPSKFIPDACSFDPGFGCTDWHIDSEAGEVSIVVNNYVGTTIDNFEITLDDCSEVRAVSEPVDNGRLIGTFNFDCPNLKKGELFKSSIHITYQKQGELVNYRSEGMIAGKAE